MVSDEHQPPNDDKLLMIEHKLLEISLIKIDGIKNDDARRHIKQGFNIRLAMIQESRIFIRENASLPRKQPLDYYMATTLSVHLNALYLNIVGAIDNLAWALQYEHNLIQDTSEDSGNRLKCSLFNKEFLSKLQKVSSKLSASLNDHKAWHAELKEFRDPAAHRIPLSVPLGVMTTNQVQDFREIEALAARPQEDLGGRSRSSYLQEASNLSTYYPIMLISRPSGYRKVGLWERVLADNRIFLDVGSMVITSLLE